MGARRKCGWEIAAYLFLFFESHVVTRVNTTHPTLQVDYPQGSQPSSNSDQTSFTYSFAEGEIYQPTEAFDFQDQEEVDDEDEEDYDDGDGDAMPQQETQSPPPPVVEPMPVVPPAAVPDADKPREMVGEQAELDELEVVAAAANRAMKVCGLGGCGCGYVCVLHIYIYCVCEVVCCFHTSSFCVLNSCMYLQTCHDDGHTCSPPTYNRIWTQPFNNRSS